MNNILEIENLNKSYPKSNFKLKDLSFSLPYGAIVGFIGENGAGKSTTMGSILGTLKKDSGYIKIFGEEMDMTKMTIKENIGVVFDHMNFSGNLDVMKLSKVLKNVYQQWDNEKFLH